MEADRPRKNDLPVATWDAIAEANQLDIQLYRYTVALFEEQIRRQGLLFTTEVKSFTWANRQFGSLLCGEQKPRPWSMRAFARRGTRRLLGIPSNCY